MTCSCFFTSPTLYPSPRPSLSGGEGNYLSPVDKLEYPAPDHLHRNCREKQGCDLGEGARAVDSDEFNDPVCLGKDGPREQYVNDKRHNDGTVAVTADQHESGRERGRAGDERRAEGDNAEAGADRYFFSPARTMSRIAMMSSTIPPAIMKSSTMMPRALKTALPRKMNAIVTRKAVRMD